MMLMAHLLFAIVCVIWGSGFLFMKKANACFGQFDIAAIRVVLAAGALFPCGRCGASRGLSFATTWRRCSWSRCSAMRCRSGSSPT
jgi:drug/metabolite transporter (DMT)-like permease